MAYLAFDLDGTLFNTEPLAIKALTDTVKELKNRGLYAGVLPQPAECTGVLGYTIKEIFTTLLPGVSAQIRKEAAVILDKYESQYLQKGVGELFPGVFETLQTLKQRGYKLLVISNGSRLYVHNVITHFNLGAYFSGLYSAGGCNVETKTELLRLVLKKHVPVLTIIGDRFSDVQAGRDNNIKSIGCVYGFGTEAELKYADIKINSFAELLLVFE